jgi:hypothetical protein
MIYDFGFWMHDSGCMIWDVRFETIKKLKKVIHLENRNQKTNL